MYVKLCLKSYLLGKKNRVFFFNCKTIIELSLCGVAFEWWLACLDTQQTNGIAKYIHMYSYSQKYFAFLKYINFKEKMLREGIILKYFSYILINITRGTQK